MPAKCTTTDLDIFRGFHDGPTCEEEQQVSAIFRDYFFYYRLPGRHLGQCSSCGHVFETAPNGKSNMAVTCPACRCELITRPAGRYGHRSQCCPSLMERHNVVFLRTAPGGAVQVYAGTVTAIWSMEYEQVQYFDDDETAGLGFPVRELVTDITHRYYLAPGVVAHARRASSVFTAWKALYYCNGGEYKALKTAGEPVPKSSSYSMCPALDDGQYYVVGLEHLGRSALQYSQAETMFVPLSQRCGYRTVRNLVSYLAWYCLRPQLEMLAKLEYHEVIDRLLSDEPFHRMVDWRATNPAAFFRLTKAEWRLFHASGATFFVLALWRAVREELTLKEFLETPNLQDLDEKQLRKLAAASEQAGVSLHRVLRRYSASELGLWADYIMMARQLDADLSQEDVALPKNLRERHDVLAEQIEYFANVELMKKYRRRYKALCQLYAYTAGGYVIRVPLSGQAIREEGRTLKHCVGGYATRHLEGRTTILFLRSVDEPDKPLCTIEMDGAQIVQIHGYHNDSDGSRPMELYKDLLAPWLAWLADGSPRDARGEPIVAEIAKEAETA